MIINASSIWQIKNNYNQMKTVQALLLVYFVINAGNLYAKPNKNYCDSIDVNNDMIIDFVIENRLQTTMDLGSKPITIVSIRPLNSNMLLYKPYVGYLFLGRGDTITKSDRKEYVWTKYRADLLNGYNNNWKVIGECKELCYIGIKIYVREECNIGWLILDIDQGNIAVSEMKLLTEDIVVIE
jgi:hypothetical protein